MSDMEFTEDTFSELLWYDQMLASEYQTISNGKLVTLIKELEYLKGNFFFVRPSMLYCSFQGGQHRVFLSFYTDVSDSFCTHGQVVNCIDRLELTFCATSPEHRQSPAFLSQ